MGLLVAFQNCDTSGGFQIGSMVLTQSNPGQSASLPNATPQLMALSPTPNLYLGIPVNLIFLNSGGPIQNCTITPALPAGLNLDPLSCLITGVTNQAVYNQQFTVVASNAAGPSNSVVLKMNMAFSLQTLQSVAVNSTAACFVVNGIVECLGDNSNGVTGQSPSLPSVNVNAPAPLPGYPSGATEVSVANSFACAIFRATVLCWGDNSMGQLGAGDQLPHVGPQVAGFSAGAGIVGLSGKGNATCAVIDGGVYCWGYLGLVAGGVNTRPVSIIPAGSGVTQVGVFGNPSDGFGACALLQGGVQCWGVNSAMNLSSATPIWTSLGAGSGVEQISVGRSHLCALLLGGVKCWGTGTFGELGNGASNSSSVPVDVAGYGAGSGVQMISAGNGVGCLLKDGAVSCWGVGLSLGLAKNVNTPTPITALQRDVQSITCGDGANAAIVNGGLWTWGQTVLSNVTAPSFAATPVAAFPGGGPSRIATGSLADHSCAIVGGRVNCWGANANQNLGSITYKTAFQGPIQVDFVISGVTSVTTSGSSSCAVSNGGAYCWGDNSFGQVGNGSTGGSVTPTGAWVNGLNSGVSKIYLGGGSGNTYGCALKSGEVWCWGVTPYSLSNPSPNMNSTTAGRSVPQKIPGLSGISDLALGGDHACALGSGRVWCWGLNSVGQVGTSTGVCANCVTAVPTQIPAAQLSGVTQISAGLDHTCALNGGGMPTCWGSNASGQFGIQYKNGTSASQPVAWAPSFSSSGFVTQLFVGAGTTAVWVSDILDFEGKGVGVDAALTAQQPFIVNPFATGSYPAQVVPKSFISANAAASGTTFLALVDGQIYGFGYGGQGLLGDGLDNPTSSLTLTQPLKFLP